ncbi:MAG: glycosyltransferase [Bacteroidales bacterium]|nr:glycosyltransferase [Bacteroidales bacterium]
MKILVVLSRFPYPLEKGDKLRAFYQIKHLSKKNEIHLFALSGELPDELHFKEVKQYCKTVQVFKLSRICRIINLFRAFFNGKPFQVGYFYSSKGHRKIKKIIHELKPDHLYCQLVRVAEYVINEKTSKTLDYQDVFSKGVERRVKEASLLLKPVFRSEYRRLLRYEEYVFELFDNKTIISAPDRDLIPHPQNKDIRIIENGVNTDFFKPVEAKTEYDILFTGNMGYPPNIDAAEYLANEIFPIVLKKNPDAVLTSAGATPQPRGKALESEQVKITGWVDDIRDCYAKTKIFIAPMRIGTGLQNKLLEAMAMKKPCITSSLANSALEAEAGNQLLVGDSSLELAEKIVFLLENPVEADNLASEGYKFVLNRFNWEKATNRLNNIMKESQERKEL